MCSGACAVLWSSATLFYRTACKANTIVSHPPEKSAKEASTTMGYSAAAQIQVESLVQLQPYLGEGEMVPFSMVAGLNLNQADRQIALTI